jgi:predicted HTH transcriptional regulator
VDVAAVRVAVDERRAASSCRSSVLYQRSVLHERERHRRLAARSGQPATRVRAEATRRRDETVTQALADGPRTRRELERLTGLTRGDLGRTLPRLKHAGRVVKEGVQGHHTWRLVKPDA